MRGFKALVSSEVGLSSERGLSSGRALKQWKGA